MRRLLSVLKWLLIVVVGLPFAALGLMLLYWDITAPAPERPPPDPVEQAKATARIACRNFIRDRLHDPDSAEWGRSSGNWYATWPAEVSAEGRARVAATFRARNAFGAQVLETYRCTVQIDADSVLLIALD
jgi:hypothetical protein